MPIDALNVLCAQLTRDLCAIAKFLSPQLGCPSQNIAIMLGMEKQCE